MFLFLRLRNPTQGPGSFPVLTAILRLGHSLMVMRWLRLL